MRRTLEAWFAHRWFALHVALLAVALCSISLRVGFQVDDYIHRALLTPQAADWPLERKAAWDVFGFFPADPQRVQRCVREGLLPWWAPSDLRLSFLRPVTSLTHWLDYRLWPDWPSVMHAQNLLWLGALTWIAARLYRTVCGGAWEAGMAGLLFAVDPAHGLPAGWIANRNALLSASFGVLAVLLYVKGCQGRRVAAWLAPVALLAGLASAELALGVPGYLLAYALLLDRGRLPRRLARLAPCAAATLAWIVLYKALGYGATGSQMYIDPAAEPLRFASAGIMHGPVLALAQLLFPPADFYNMTLLSLRSWYALIAAVAVAALLAVMYRRLRNDRVAGFWLLGMALSILPSCGTAPSNRLLVVAGVGGLGLIARFLARLREGREPSADMRPSRAGRWLGYALVTVHLILAPPALTLSAWSSASFGPILRPIADSFPQDPPIADQHLVILQAPTTFVFQYAATLNALEGRALPRRMFVLGSSLAAMDVRRADERSLALRPRIGFLPPPGTPTDPQAADPPPVSLRYLMQMFDVLFRSLAQPFRVGETIHLEGIEARVTEVTADGRPLEVIFVFNRPLEDPRYRWMIMKDERLAPVSLPAVGERVTLPPVELPF